jgi:hypothetical protein
MMRNSKDARINLFILAAVCVAALLYTTHQMCRLSSWIVYHDHVWGEMDSNGHGSEHYAAEAFHQFRFWRGPIIEAIVGLVFLVLLWRHLFMPRPTLTRNDRPSSAQQETSPPTPQ